jgi:hypothetical protein
MTLALGFDEIGSNLLRGNYNHAATSGIPSSFQVIGLS